MNGPAVSVGAGGHNAPWGVRDLTVRFGRRVALNGVTLSARPGAVTAVCGGDGAGKTTLLRALAGGVRPAEGRVERPDRARIGYVGGSGGLYTDLSVAENIAFVAEAYGLRGDGFAARTERLLERIGLEGTSEQLAGRLSGGMRQKLAFALAMLHQPELLILDEPTTGLDPISRAELWRLIAGAAADGAAVVVSTSYPNEAERAASVVFLEEGRMSTPAQDRQGATDAAGDVRYLARHADEARGDERQTLAGAAGVTRRFGGIVAVDGVDLAVRAGEVVGLLGANGAGKTTLIRLLLGLLQPTSGRVELFGAPPSRSTRSRIGYVPQSLGLWEDLTVRENLAFVAASFGRPAPELEDDMAEAGAVLVRDLPLGLRRRVAFLAALSHTPDLLVLDEPTSGVSIDARRRVWDTIHAAAHAGAGVLVTTHHMEEAGECDRLIVMSAGRVVAEGPLDGILAGHHAVAVTVDDWVRAFNVLEQAGLPVALVGRALRVPDADPDVVLDVLRAHDVPAGADVSPATFEETFVALALAGSESPSAPARDSVPGAS